MSVLWPLPVKNMKTNKSFSRRIKVTKNGTMLSRPVGQNHFNAKSGGEKRLQKKGLTQVTLTTRVKRRFLPKS